MGLATRWQFRATVKARRGSGSPDGPLYLIVVSKVAENTSMPAIILRLEAEKDAADELATLRCSSLEEAQRLARARLQLEHPKRQVVLSDPEQVA
jgi:hypothetical protein